MTKYVTVFKNGEFYEGRVLSENKFNNCIMVRIDSIADEYALIENKKETDDDGIDDYVWSDEIGAYVVMEKPYKFNMDNDQFLTLFEGIMEQAYKDANGGNQENKRDAMAYISKMKNDFATLG